MKMADNQEENTVITTDATSEIKSNILAYGEEVLLSKFPSNVDGLKAIVRRVLWFTRQYTSKTALGRLIGELLVVHTSGDASIYDAMIRLGQPFMIGHPLLTIYGNYGSYYNPKGAAAYRYLTANLSDFARDVFYEGINLSTLPMSSGKTTSIIEPMYFIPKVPMALVLGNLTIGLGFKSTTPLIDFCDVCDLVKIFADHHHNKGLGNISYKELAPHLVPQFPIQNLIKNRKELIAAYSNGDFNRPIVMEGWVEIGGSTIILRALPYGVNVAEETGKLREALSKNRKHELFEYIDSVNDHSDKETKFTFNLKRGRNPFEVWDILKKILRFNLRWTPIPSYVRSGKVVNLAPPILIDYWYRERCDSIRNSLKSKQADLVFKKMRTEAMLLIVDHKDEVINIIKNSYDLEDATKKLIAKFKKLSISQAHVIYRQQIGILAKSSRGPLEEDLKQIKADLETVAESFNKIHETVANDALYLKKKYGPTTQTKFSDDFMGYVQFGDWGCTNFFNLADMKDILSTRGWPASITKAVHFYNSKTPKRFADVNGRLVLLEEMPRHVRCRGMLQCPASERDELTLIVGNGTTCVVERLMNCEASEDVTMCPISKTFYAIHRKGEITKENYKSLAIRKSMAIGTKSDILYGISEKCSDMIVFYASTANRNVLRASRILRADSNGSLRTVAAGRTYILGAYPASTKMIALNIPAACRTCGVETIIINGGIEKLFVDGKNDLILNFNKTGTVLGEYKLARDPDVKSLFTISLNGRKVVS